MSPGAAMTIALANTLFFAAASAESKGKVGLYLLLTIASVTARPGFLHAGADGARPLPPGAGLPIGAIAAFFGMSNRLVNMADIPPNEEFFLLGRVPRQN